MVNRFIFFLALLAASIFPFSEGVHAARVQAISYGVYPATVGVGANHTVVFQTKSAISSGMIRVYFKNIVSSLGSVGVNDIDLSSGSSVDASATTQYLLGASAGASTWGVNLDTTNKILTFTYPTSGGSTIAQGQFVAIKIGTHATSQATGANQMTNAASAGRKDASLIVGTDVHLFSVGLFSGTQVSIPEVNYPTTTPAQTESAPPPAIPITAVPQSNPQQLSPQPSSQPSSQPAAQHEQPQPSEQRISPQLAEQPAPVSQKREIAKVFMPPLAPKTLTSSVGQITLPAVDIQWSDDSQNVARATLERKIGSGLWVRIADVRLADASFRDRAVEYQVLYTYRLKVFAEDGSFNLSQETSVTTSAKPIPKTEVVAPQKAEVTSASQPTPPAVGRPQPAVPAKLAARADSHQRISLTWTDTSDVENAFQIQRRPAFPEGIADAFGAVTLAANETRFRDLAVDPATTYQYRVRSINESVKSGDENYSAWVSVTTLQVPLPPPPPPLRPEGVKAADITATSVTVTWQPIVGEDSVTIQRRSKSESQFTDLISLPKDRAEYIDRTVDAETEYVYRVIARNADGESPHSVEVVATTGTRVFDRKKTQVTFAPPTAEKMVDTTHGDVIESKSKLGTGVGIQIPAAVHAYVEGAAPLVQESSTAPTADTTAPIPTVPSVSNYGSIPALPNEVNFSVRAVAPTPSLVSAQFGDSVIIDRKPTGFASADGIGPLYVIGAQVENTHASARSTQHIHTQSESFWSRLKALAASFVTAGVPYAVAQSSAQQGSQSLYPDYQKQLPITRFDPALSYVFSYAQEDIVNVDEKTIKLFSWNSDADQWVLEPSKLDAESNTITASLGHLTIFRLFGEALGVPASAKKEIIVVPSAAAETIETEITNADLGLSESVTAAPVPIAKKKFYTTPNSSLAMCIPGTIFKKAVKKITLSVGSVKYPLAYQKQKDCYAASITIPDVKGRQDVVLKIVYIDDQIQQIRLETEITTEFQARLLTTVVPAVQQVQEAAVAANEAVKVTVEKTAVPLQTAAIATVPVVTAANPAILSNTVNAWTYIHHLILCFLSVLGLRKQRRPWGVVYNSITKQPVDLAIVRLFDSKTKKLVETQVTDKDGRFSFLPSPGEYTLSVAKLPLLFPSKLISSPSDGAYPHVYRQEPIIISAADQIIDMSIPVDPPAPEKDALRASPLGVARGFIANVSKISLVGGFVVSILLAMYVPSTLNTALLVVNWVYSSIQIFLMVKGEKPWGVVFDVLTLQPVPLAAISIFDQKSQKLLRTRLTDYLGRFAFLTPPGDYLLSVNKELYEFPAQKIENTRKFRPFYEGGALHINKKNQLIKVNVPLAPKK